MEKGTRGGDGKKSAVMAFFFFYIESLHHAWESSLFPPVWCGRGKVVKEADKEEPLRRGKRTFRGKGKTEK